MDSDEQSYSILSSSYSSHPTNQNRMNTTHQQPLRDHILHPAPRQFQDNYGQPSMLHNTSRYRDSSRTVKVEHDVNNTYLYPTPIDFRGEMNINVAHHPTHPPDHHNTMRYPASHNPYSDSNTIRMASSPLESPEARLASGPAESGSADFRYQMRAALQPHLLHPQRHQHRPLPHHHHPNHSLNHLQGGSAFYPSPINYSSQPDQEHGSPSGMRGGLDQPQTHSSLEYDSRESHAHVPPGMVYDSLAVPTSHSQQGVVRRDSTMNPHHGGLTSINSDNSGSGGGSYHTTTSSNSPVSSIPMSNNHGTTTSSMNSSVLSAHISSSPYSIGPSSNMRWAGHHHHPSGFDMPGCSTTTSTTHNQIPTSAPTTTSASSSSLRSSLHHADSDSRLTPPENSFTQDNSANTNTNYHLRTSTSAQTLSSSHSPSPLSENGSTSPGGCGSSERFNNFNNNNPDDRDGSDQDVVDSAGRKGVVVIKAGEEEEKKETSTDPPVKKKKKSKMHICEICFKKFPRPSGLRTHMNTHSHEKPYPCGFPGCTRSFGVRSNAKRHLRTHGVLPTPATNPNSSDPPYIVGFCPPMIGGAPQPSSSSSSSSCHPSHHHHQLHSVEGGGESDFPPLPGDSRLSGDPNAAANIQLHHHHHHTQDYQGPSDVQQQQQQQHEMMNSGIPTVKLRWMPPSLTTRTNAGSLREVVDEQQHWMRDVVEEEEDGGEDDRDDDFAAGIISHARRTSGGGYENTSMDMDHHQRLRLTVPRSAAECSTTVYSPPPSSSESPSTCRPPSSSSSRIIVGSSISPSSNSSLSPPATMSSGYGQQQQQQHEIDHISNVGGGGPSGGDVSLYATREYGGV